MLNRKDFLFNLEAKDFIPILVPTYATTVSIKKDAGGYWLNVTWNCGVTAPLTIQETEQALGENNA